jgi:ParB family transcriptional regulator, chromosome partitioning protein
MSESVAESVYLVPLDEIQLTDGNVRQHQADKDLQELADSIRELGQLQPIVLAGTARGPGPHTVVVGQRRFLAHRDILSKDDPRWRTIRATYAGPLSKEEMRVRSLVENMQRVELNYVDAAKAVTELFERHGRDDRAVARLTGMSLQRVRQYLQIEALATEDMKGRIERREVSPADVKRALQAAQFEAGKAERLLDLMVANQFTRHDKTRLAEYAAAHGEAPPEEMAEQALRPRIEDNLIVSLRPDLKKALTEAAANLRMEPEEVVTAALGDWLSGKGFLVEDVERSGR